MKSISAAIVVLAGTATLVAGAFHPHGDTKLFVCGVGVFVGVVGLIGWARSLRGPE
jgi:hypothetical protein